MRHAADARINLACEEKIGSSGEVKQQKRRLTSNVLASWISVNGYIREVRCNQFPRQFTATNWRCVKYMKEGLRETAFLSNSTTVWIQTWALHRVCLYSFIVLVDARGWDNQTIGLDTSNKKMTDAVQRSSHIEDQKGARQKKKYTYIYMYVYMFENSCVIIDIYIQHPTGRCFRQDELQPSLHYKI